MKKLIVLIAIFFISSAASAGWYEVWNGDGDAYYTIFSLNQPYKVPMVRVRNDDTTANNYRAFACFDASAGDSLTQLCSYSDDYSAPIFAGYGKVGFYNKGGFMKLYEPDARFFIVKSDNTEVFNVSSNGNVSMPTTSAVNAIITSQVTISSGAWQKIPLNLAMHDTQSEFSNGTVTIREAGIYGVSGKTQFNTFAANVRAIISVVRNGNFVSPVIFPSYGTLPLDVIYPYKQINCAAGDTLELWIYQETGSDKTIAATNESTFLVVGKVR